MRSATVRLPGHPDQLCDLVAEAIVDEYTKRDPESRLRIHVQGGRGVMFVSGDILSQADFDVSSLVKRTIGLAGVTDEVEPFISLEHVAAERVGSFRLGTEAPISVVGYATSETVELLPQTVVLARRVARWLQEQRKSRPEWFWLGPDGEVTVIAKQRQPSSIFLSIEHGQEPLDHVREMIKKEIVPIADLPLEINQAGICEARGLRYASGASGHGFSIYGSLLPGFLATGRDAQSVEKAGSWLARSAARTLLKKTGAQAIMVQATYLPAEKTPRVVVARDEKGSECTSQLTIADLSLERVKVEWRRAGLHTDIVRWNMTGESPPPWEE